MTYCFPAQIKLGANFSNQLEQSGNIVNLSSPTLSPSQGLKLESAEEEDVNSHEKSVDKVPPAQVAASGKEDGLANAPSPRPNYGDARDM